MKDIMTSGENCHFQISGFGSVGIKRKRAKKTGRLMTRHKIYILWPLRI